MASEILQGKEYIIASDIYSFGMIMWELIIVRMPFWDQNNDIELIIRIFILQILKMHLKVILN